MNIGLAGLGLHTYDRGGLQYWTALPAPEAVAYARDHYDRRAVATPWQHRYVTCFTTG